MDPTVVIRGHRLRNAVMTASGCAGWGREIHRFFDLSRLGAFVTPSVTVSAQVGTDAPRILETPAGLVWDTALPNPGAAVVAVRELAWLGSVGAAVILSVAGGSSSEFAEVAQRLRASDAFGCVIALEVNLTVGNGSTAGSRFDEDALAAATVVGRVREQLPRDIAVVAKLAVDAPDLVGVAAACVEAGADALTIGHGPAGMALQVHAGRREGATVVGRVSGPATRPQAALAVHGLHQAMIAGRMERATIIGAGGVRSAGDARELLSVGAAAVQVGSATFADPGAPVRVIDDLAAPRRSRTA